jgi:hypothetical protein
MARKVIDPKQPPILWDAVNSAFADINDNFTELYLSIGGGGAVDLTALSTNIVPSTNSIYDLGSSSRRWRDLYLSGNSIHLGSAVLSSTGSIVNLPAGSTIGGQLIKDPIEASFKTISVSGQSDIVADNTTDTLTFVNGTGITMTTVAGTDSLTITNTGVTQLIGTAGQIGVSGTGKGNVTLTNLGVTSATAGTGIGVSAATGGITIVNTGVVKLLAGTGIILDPSIGTGTVTITNSSPNITQNIWRFIAVAGQSSLDPQNASDVLTFANGTGINITTNAGSDTVTVTNTGVTSIAGSTGISVSAATGSVTLTNTGVTSLTAGAGISVSSSTGSITISNTKVGFVNIGVQGQDSCIADAVSDTLTFIAGTGIELSSDPSTDTITISAEGNIAQSIFGEDSTLLVDAVNSEIVGNINSYHSGNSILMHPTNGVIIGGTGGASVIGAATAPVYIGAGPSGSTTGPITIGHSGNATTVQGSLTATNFFTSLIDSTDSSTITFVPTVVFNTDGTFENDLIVRNKLTVFGSIANHISIPELKTLVAASTDFADFKARIAALA